MAENKKHKKTSQIQSRLLTEKINKLQQEIIGDKLMVADGGAST